MVIPRASRGGSGSGPYLLCGEVWRIPAPCQRGGIVLSRLRQQHQEVEPLLGEALCLKPLESA